MTMSGRTAGLLTKLRAFGQPVINTFFDYQAVAKDCVSEIRKKPVRSLRNLFIIGGAVYMWYTNPDEQSYWNQVTSDSNELILVSDAVRNPRCTEYMQFLWTNSNGNQLKYVNCGLFSLVIKSPQPTVCKSYEYECSHLKPGPITFYRRIVDVGLVNRWLYVAKEMEDYDINDEQLSKVTV